MVKLTAKKFDAIVIGTGPAGEAGAIKLAKSGKSVAIIDQRSQVGGNCAHLGTIPSKALRETVYNLMSYQRDPLFSQVHELKHIALDQVMAYAKKVSEQQIATRSRFYDRNSIPVFYGIATIQNDHLLEVISNEKETQQLAFDQLLIATGSRPYRPSFLDFDHPRVFDSDKILQLNYAVHKIIIYGAGVIGCEYASIFIGLGYKVELINTQAKLLSYLDDEIADALSYHLRQLGVVVRHNEHIDELTTASDHVVLSLKSGKRIKADAILWCNGRTGNTDLLNLSAAELSANERGQLLVNEQYQTACEHIFAAGDVIGWPSLASAAFDQGRIAASHMLGEKNIPPVASIPTGIYTIPEISSIGRTEQELTDDKVPYEIGHAFFRHLARAQITGETAGVLKILFHRETLEILGIHCFGNNAAEIVHIGQAVMLSSNSLLYFTQTTFNYPTMAEAYRVAALNGLNRIF